MATKKKTQKARKKPSKKAPRKKAAKRSTSKKRTPARKRPSVLRAKHGKLRIAVQRAGVGYEAKVENPAGGAMRGATGATPQEAVRATKALLGGRRSAARSAGSLREARMRSLCRTFT